MILSSQLDYILASYFAGVSWRCMSKSALESREDTRPAAIQPYLLSSAPRMKQTLATRRTSKEWRKKILNKKGTDPVRVPAARINQPTLPSRSGASTARPRNSIRSEEHTPE